MSGKKQEGIGNKKQGIAVKNLAQEKALPFGKKRHIIYFV
jgi:hypothetical protein